ncbi:hypothetical protein ABXS75_11930 [Roseburia hominis]
MPFITIKSIPKDENVKKSIVTKIVKVFEETYGCNAEHVSISIEECSSATIQQEIQKNMDKIYILRGNAVK